jgi:hypothetical protein
MFGENRKSSPNPSEKNQLPKSTSVPPDIPSPLEEHSKRNLPKFPLAKQSIENTRKQEK